MAEILTKIKLRTDTSANWNTNNPILLKGEIGIESDTKKFKIGTGDDSWKVLGYANIPWDDLFTAEGKIKEELLELPEQQATQVFRGTKTDVSATDESVITKYFETDHPEQTPVQGDVFVVTTLVEEVTYAQSGYIYDGSAWIALAGTVDADKVIFTKDFVLAGNYTNIGNFTKASTTATGSVAAKGKSVQDIFEQMTAKELQPVITAQPAVSGFSLQSAGAVEAGTKVAQTSFGTATLSKGSYTYGSANVTATGYSIDRVCTPSSMSQTGLLDTASGTDDNSGAGFIIGDAGDEQAGVVSSLAYKVTVTHGEGEVAKTNLGNNSNPPVKIEAGSKTMTTKAYTSFRQFFYGTSSEKGSELVLDSTYIRGLTNSNKAYAPQTITLVVPAGAKRVDIACIATATGVTKVINETALNADVTSTFVKTTVQVEGAQGYKAVDYNVWSFVPPEAYGNSATLKVTLG